MTKNHQFEKQMRQIESLFGDNKKPNTINVIESKKDHNCDVHGRKMSNGSVYSLSKRDSLRTDRNLNETTNFINKNKSNIGPRRESMPALNGSSSYYNRVYTPVMKTVVPVYINASSFPSILRKSSISLSQSTLRSPTNQRNQNNTKSYEKLNNSSLYSKLQLQPKQQPSVQMRQQSTKTQNLNKRNSFCGDLRRHEGSMGSSIFLRRDSSGNTNLIRRDSIGSQASRRNSINDKDIHVINGHVSSGRIRNDSITRDYVSGAYEPNKVTSPSSAANHEIISILRKKSPSNSVYDDCVNDDDNLLTTENLKKHVTLMESSKNDRYSARRRSSIESGDSSGTRKYSMDSLDLRRNSLLDYRDYDVLSDTEKILAATDPNRPKFVAVTTLEDVQAVRCAEFHPNGKIYAVGSNSKTFRICEYPSLSEIREEHTTYQPTVLFKRTKHHKGSIYCMAWSPQGDLVATGSNDKTVKLMRYNDVQKQLEGRETELTMHDGTVRDLCFIEDSSNQSSLLISGGAGDCKIYVTDCATATPFQALSGHGGHVLSLYNWGGAMFVSGSQDKTVRFWDLRTRGCVNSVTPATTAGSRTGSPVASLCVDPSGRLLVSGHEDSSCVLYDIRGNRPIQCFKPHSSDIRSIRFSPSAYYLLTGGYDNKLVLTDLQGDLTLPLPSVVVAQHTDKIISGRWHPTDFSFISTSADKTATLWALPPI